MEDDAAAYLNTAKESLASAESDYRHARYNSCANRCYYACFQAAIAALLREGIRPVDLWGHDFVRAQFVGLLINRRKRYPSEFRNTITDTMKLRIIADYEAKLITQTRARRALARTRTLVKTIAERETR